MIIQNNHLYQARRKRLFNRMDDGSVALIFSGVPKIKSEDEDYPFEVQHSFYYLTGIEEEDCCLMLVSNAGERKEYLFVPPFDPVKQKWYGKRLSLDEASQIAGIRNVLVNGSLESRVNAELCGAYSDFGTVDKAYLDLGPEIKIAAETTTKDYGETLKKTYPGLVLYDIAPLLMKMRMVKEPEEIECLRAACATTRLGVQALMAATRPGVREFELSHIFSHVISDDNACNGLSFNTIVASGKHACTLHYPHPMGTLEDGDMLLLDCGARQGYYCGDVSRSFPVNGKFTPIQKTIYEIVLGANKAVAQMARPGVTIQELQSLASTYMANECVAHGLLEKKEDITKVYWHSVSHHIGLDCHDVSDRQAKLEAGNVISDEPGLYFEELGIGVRIEDDLYITEKGCEVLTADIIKEVEDIEAFFAGGKRPF